VSARSDVMAALVALFQGITPGAGVGYVYAPSAVKRIQFFPGERTLDLTLDTIYLIRVERENHVLGPTSCSVDGTLETYILVARRNTSLTEVPFTYDPMRCPTVDDLIDDAKEALIRDPTLGGKAIDALSQGVIVERDFASDTWVAAELRLGIMYRYTRPPGSIPR
jgi:hypothetical protein